MNLAVGGESQTALETRNSLQGDNPENQLNNLQFKMRFGASEVVKQLAHTILTSVTQHYLNICSIHLFSPDDLLKIAAISNI